MDPATIAAITATVTGLAALGRLVVQEIRWYRGVTKEDAAENKRRKKAAKKAQAAEFERRRKELGLADEGGGSRLGKEARAEYDKTGGNEWEKAFHAEQRAKAKKP